MRPSLPTGILLWLFAVSAMAAGVPTVVAETEFDPQRLRVPASADAPVSGPEYPILRWRLETDGPIRSGPAEGPDGLIVFGSDDGRLRAVAPDGTVRWTVSLDAPIRSAPTSAPDGAIFVGADDGRFYALRPDGTIRWAARFEAPVRCRPALTADGAVIVTAGSVIAALDRDGRGPRWRWKTDRKFLSDPVVLPSGRIAAGADGGFLLIHGADGTPEIARRIGFKFVSTPAPAPGGDLYLGSGRNELISATEEGIRNWVAGSGNHQVGPPATGPDGIAVAGSDNGYFFAVTSAGKRKWGVRTGDWVTARPAVDGAGRVYAGSWDGSLYATDPEGAIRWRYDTGGAIEADPLATSDGTLVVPSVAGSLHALGVPPDIPILAVETRNRADGSPLSGATVALVSESGAERPGIEGPPATTAFARESGNWRIRTEAEGFAPQHAEIPQDPEKRRLILHLVPVGALRLPGASLPPGTAETEYMARFPLSGGVAPYVFSIAAGELPEGIALDPGDGALTGTPTETGIFEFALAATDAEGRTARRSFALEVDGELRLTSASPLPEAMVGYPYEFAMEAVGGLPPIRFSPAGDGAIPAGLRLSPGGVLSGIPESPGEGTVTVKIGNRNQEIEASILLPALERLRVTTEFLPDAVTGRPYEAKLEATGGTGERTLAVSGTLPAGLGFDGERIAGTAAREEMGTIRVRVSDAAGREAARDFPFAAVEPLALATDRMPTARTGEEYRESIPVIGGMPPYALEILDPLPEGLALDPETGEIAGTPTEAIWTHVRIAATDRTTPAQRMEGILEVRTDASDAGSFSRAPSN